MAYNYDYSRTMWLKMFMAEPDFPNNKSKVYITYEQALDLIKAMDAMTQGIKKIVYLVGWQGFGHDDCYPEMSVMNEALKRECDACAHDSYLWLFEEAKKYNTVISVHGNLADAYEATPCFPEMVKAGAVCQHKDGTPAVIEIFNGRNAYKTCYKEYLESGLFKKNWQEFLDTLPIKEAGTVHLDNFCLVENLYDGSTYSEQIQARNEMIKYITKDCGIDLTTEYTYRELPLREDEPRHPICKYYGNFDRNKAVKNTVAPIHCLGSIAAAWWLSNMTPSDCIRIPANVYTGFMEDEALFNVFYGSMHGEEIWRRYGIDAKEWAPDFIRKFCLQQLPFQYLNRYARLSIQDENGDPDDKGRFTVHFSEGVVTGRYRTITKNGVELKRGDNVILPLKDDNETFVAYSKEGKKGLWNMPDADFTEANVYEMSPEGNKFLFSTEIKNHQIELDIQAGQALVILKK